METTISVKHNVEMAHRLSLLPGKCEAIHGHSWWVTLSIRGEVDKNGILLEFGRVKKSFRNYLDTVFDHRLVLNTNDPLLAKASLETNALTYPGLKTLQGDPTTENIAADVLEWARWTFAAEEQFSYRVEVWETSANCATIGDF